MPLEDTIKDDVSENVTVRLRNVGNYEVTRLFIHIGYNWKRGKR